MSFSGSWRSFKNRERSRPPQKKANTKKVLKGYVPLPATDANAIVSRVFTDGAMVYLNDGTGEIQCNYKRSWLKGLLTREVSLQDRAPLSVGDRVQVLGNGTHRTILGRTDRSNRLSRYAPGKDGHSAHVMASNLDQVLIVASALEPDFNPTFVDRVLAGCFSEVRKILLCVNKMDLFPGAAGKSSPWDFYRTLPLKLVESSALNGRGMDELSAHLRAHKTAVVGLSGAGKTSLLRSLTGESLGKIGRVSEATKKGKHTTTTSQLYPWERKTDAFIVDTPGVREFDPIIPMEELKRYYFEFSDLECSVRECNHVDSSKCDAIGLVRYESYRKIYLSLRRIQHGE